MSGSDPDRLYKLLPVVYRMRDADLGEPLRALLQVIAEQVNLVEADIAQLYDNWFIETCQDWVVPYIGDLIGYRSISAAAPGEQRRSRGVSFPRREVANTIGNRRRKGTLALLEQLAFDVAGWPARAVEFYTLLSLTQSLDHLRLDRGRSADLRQPDSLDRIGGAFDELAHTASLGAIDSPRTRSRYNIPEVGLFIWRLKPYSITRAPAYCVDRARNHYTFSILGNNAPLITRPVVEPEPAHIADELNVPAWIRRNAFDERTADYYGRAKSLRIWRDDFDKPVPLERIVPADLSNWAYRPQHDQVAVDPVLGRIIFSPRNAPEHGVWVSYYYGFSDDLGGGEYQRPLSPVAGRHIYRVGPGHEHHRIMQAVERWRADKQADPTRQNAIVEIVDSGEYSDPLDIRLDPGDRLDLRAAQGARPVIRVLDRYSNRPDHLRIRGPSARAEQSGHGLPYQEAPQHPQQRPPIDCRPAPDDRPPPPRITLDGLLITGRSLQIRGAIGEVVIRHCTLVPGWSLDHECEPENQEEPSLELEQTTARLVVERSILGSLRVNLDEVRLDPAAIVIDDSILDATDPEIDSLSAPEGRHAHATLSIRRCTVIGRVLVHAIELAENTIFDGLVKVARHQRGCVRFCYVPRESRTPRRYNCQPDLVLAAVQAEYLQGKIDQAERDRAQERQALRVRPLFNSRRYGTPTYCQLAESCAPEIARGADDESEIGAFHDLFQPQREDNLNARLDEYTPAGADAGIIFVT